jgi:hypothetical protein
LLQQVNRTGFAVTGAARTGLAISGLAGIA